MAYPRMVRLKQQFPRPRVDNIPAAVRDSLAKLHLEKTIKPKQTVALTAGSRGIANIPLILKSVVQFVKDLGAEPFLVPAMGSHGGGTAEGQREVLESYGITEAFVGAPIRASMEVDLAGQHAGRLSGGARQDRQPGRPHRRRRPRQAAHQLPRPDRKRPDENDDDRPGQARRRRQRPQDSAGTALRRRGPGRRQGHARQGSHRLRPGRRRKRLRRDRPDRRRPARRLRAGRGEAARQGPRLARPSCRSTRPICSSSTRSARRSAAPAWTPTSSAASGPSR